MDNPVETDILNNIDNICRTCLSEGDLKPLFKDNIISSAESVLISDMLMECSSIQVLEGDGLPSHMCSQCVKQMIDAYAFRQQCNKSDCTLRSLMLKSNLTHEKVNMKSISPEYLSNNDNIETSETYDITIDNDSVSNSNCEKFTEDIDTNSCENSEIYSEPLDNSNDKVLTVRKKTNKSKNRKRKYTHAPFKCKKCEDIFTTKAELNEHMKTKKHPYRRILCNVCAKPLSFRHIDVHMRTHTKEKPYACNICGARFTVNGNLRRHIMTHTGERPHTCEFCGKGFIQAVSLEEHIRVHTGERPFVCNYCGKAYKQSKQFKMHVKKHIEPETYKSGVQRERKKNDIPRRSKTNQPDDAERSHICEVCDRRFTTKTILSAHMLTHGDKKFLCSDCGKGFVTKIGLQSHSKVHTGEKPYSCNVCGKTFAHTASLKVHTYVHTGEKHYACKICDKKFSQSSHLRTHVRLHSGVKPYSCSVCSKHFTLKGNLTVHMRIHMGEKPFACCACGKGFYDSSNLKKHQTSHCAIYLFSNQFKCKTS